MSIRDNASDINSSNNNLIAYGDGLSAHANEIAMGKHKIARPAQASKTASSPANKHAKAGHDNDHTKLPGSVPLLKLMKCTPQFDTRTEKDFTISQPVNVERSNESQKVIPISPKELREKVKEETGGSGDFAFADISGGIPGKSFFEKYSFKGIPKEQRPNAVVLAVDCSWSVLQPDEVLTEYKHGEIVRQSIKHTRWEYVLGALKKILDTLPDDMPVGIRIFGAEPLNKQTYEPVCRCHNSELVEPVRFNRPRGQESVFHHFLSQVPKIKPIHETPIPFAIEQAVTNDLKGIEGNVLVVEIGDGKSTCGDPRVTAEMIKQMPLNRTVKFDAIGVMQDKQSQNEMGDLAKALNGSFNNVDKKDVKEAIHSRKHHGTGATILPSTKDSHRLIHGYGEMNWDEDAEK